MTTETDLPTLREKLPDPIPTGELRVRDERHTYTVHDDGHAQATYHLNKAPVLRVEEVAGTVDGHSHTFTAGTDYQVIDDTGDGKIDSVDFSLDGATPDANTEFAVTYVAKPIVDRYVSAFDADIRTLDGAINTSIEAKQVDNAELADLERIGALFGDLGRRRGRNKDEYRALIKSIVQSFAGRGTKPGMKFAIAAGIGTDTDNITITEDYQQVGYEIQIDNVDTGVLVGAINDMADLADPSGVNLLSPPIIVLDGEDMYIGRTESTTSTSIGGLGTGALTLDGNSTLS